MSKHPIVTYSIRQAVYGSEDYHASVRLRDQELRRPLGMTISEADVVRDGEDILFVAKDDGGVFGCVSLRSLGEDRVKIRQMVVAASHQRQGVGAALMRLAESEAVRLGLIQAELHARDYAEEFYRRLGYRPEGEKFIEATIPHIRMVRQLA